MMEGQSLPWMVACVMSPILEKAADTRLFQETGAGKPESDAGKKLVSGEEKRQL